MGSKAGGSAGGGAGGGRVCRFTHAPLQSRWTAGSSVGDAVPMDNLGHGNTKHQLTPKHIAALVGHRIVHVDAGSNHAGSHAIMLTESGRVFSCGFNGDGRLGLGDTEHRSVPTEVTGLGSQHVVGVAAGWQHSLAIGAGGAVYTWGRLFQGGAHSLTRPSLLSGFPTVAADFSADQARGGVAAQAPAEIPCA